MKRRDTLAIVVLGVLNSLKRFVCEKGKDNQANSENSLKEPNRFADPYRSRKCGY